MTLSRGPHLDRLIGAVIQAWPDHRKFIDTSFAGYQEAELRLLEDLASRVLRLVGDDLAEYVASYRWMCVEFNKEAFYFKKHGAYRLSTFEEAERHVYSNAPFMRRYMQGLLLSQVLWRNHATSFLFFRSRYLAQFDRPFRYLEVGPGHGLFLSSAAEQPLCLAAEGWDVSPESVRQTAHALEALGCADKVALHRQDIMQAEASAAHRYDAIVISEVLEHLEQPAEALRKLRPLLSDGGRMFINVPINSPAPDHIFLLRSGGEVRELVESTGLDVETLELAPMTGLTVAAAEKQAATISCLVIAR